MALSIATSDDIYYFGCISTITAHEVCILKSIIGS